MRNAASSCINCWHGTNRQNHSTVSITSHFYLQAWVTVSQEYNVEQIFWYLISCIIVALSDELPRKSQRIPKEKLAERLRKHLKEQRYLTILLTSRLREVVEYASLGNSPLNMCLLYAVESWNLYCKVFGKTEFPFLFEQIGRDVVKKCEGLPLAIIVIVGLLSKMEKGEVKWMNVAKKCE